MAKYIPRLTAPEKTDPHWLRPSAGGVNTCVAIKNGSVLPNCVGYAWGRWYELLGSEPKLSRSNAEVWYNKADGYERGQEPKLGAVVCWSKGVVGVGKDGAGHVAIVEQIQADGTIVTSNSGYGGSRWYKKALKPPYTLKGYDFQGFIYLPMEFNDSVIYRSYAGWRWLPEVEDGGNEYAGKYGKTLSGLQVRLASGRTVAMCAHILGRPENSWLPEVTKWDGTGSGYAGIKGKAMDGITISAEGVKLRYRVHLKGSCWLQWVSGYDTGNCNSGYAGILGKEIDAVQIEIVE